MAQREAEARGATDESVACATQAAIVDKITFLASFPPVDSALRISGNGNGMRIMLDIPETEMAEGVKLLALTQKRLKITIEESDDDRIIGRRTAKQRK